MQTRQPSLTTPRRCITTRSVIGLTIVFVLVALVWGGVSSAAAETIDDVVGRCPTAAEMSVVDAAIALTFESTDPAAQALVCFATDGSRDLTKLQRNAYNVLIAAQKISFSKPLPWSNQTSVWNWLVLESGINAIRFRGDIAQSFCCTPPDAINLEVVPGNGTMGPGQTTCLDASDGWDNPFATTIQCLGAALALVVHEARHHNFGGHDCGFDDDQTVDEAGAWGAQIYYYLWLNRYTDIAFLRPNSGSPNAYVDSALATAGFITGRVCNPPASLSDLTGQAPSPRPLQLPAPIVFGPQTVGTQSAFISEQLVNTSGSDVVVSNADISNPVEFAFSPPGGIVTSGSSIPFSVAFRPSGVGQRTAVIAITSHGLGGPQLLSVSGTGVAPTYSVNYVGNGNTGGSIPVDGKTYVTGDTVTVLGNVGNLVRTGFTFGNWNTSSDGTGTPYAPGANFAMGAANVTLYAHWSMAGSTPLQVGAASRRVHGAAGTFDLPLSLADIHNPSTEPRQGPNQTIVFTFDKPVNAATVSVSEGVATAAAPTFSGNDVVVGLTAVSNQQYVTVTLTNVASTDGGTGGTGEARIGFLLGDVNQTRVVSVADLGIVNSVLAQVVTASNYLKDVNVSGTLSVADKGITNANLTKALPPP